MSVATDRRLTRGIARSSSTLEFAQLPADVVELARQALLDWFGVTIGGSLELAPAVLLEQLAPAGAIGAPGVTVLGRSQRLPPLQAALVNGTASHVLDFDDVNLSLPGHASVAALAAVIALAEQRGASGRELITAFVAGYETTCRVALAVGPEPYMRGSHATGTIGTLGAAAACARLLGLDESQSAVALGIAASQAAGLKCNFGTMTKSLHAGKACENGLLSALLAARGFTASADAIEADEGFAAVAAGNCDIDAALGDPDLGWHLRENLFKHHAACYFTHSAIEGVRELRGGGRVAPEDVARVALHVSDVELGACVIARPATALEVKFSISHLAAMALLGRDTAVITDEDAGDADVIALRDRVALVHDGTAGRPTLVQVELRDGATAQAAVDVNRPPSDLVAQRERLTAKFRSLAEPVIGAAAAGELHEQLAGIDTAPDVRRVIPLSAG